MRTCALAVIATALAGFSTAANATPTAAERGAPTVGPGATTSTVTLITGDVVRLDTDATGHQRASVVRAADRRGGIHTFTSGGDVYVEPAAAAPLLAAGRLDEQLFDVSALVRQGYDDARRPSLPLIMSYRPGFAPQAAPAGSHLQANLTSAHALALTETKTQATSFWASVARRSDGANSDGAKVWLDAQVRATLDQSVPQIGAPAAWARGYNGQGVDIALLDSGIDANHPDFAGRIGATQDFTGSGDVVDRAGHGTHVASIAAGTGAASGNRYRGVAPAATLMIGKVLDADGFGAESWVINGMQWAASHGADVVNLSLGGPVTKGDDPMSQALDALSAQYHTLFVVAAGNTSPGVPGTPDVTTPGAARSALTVGAVSKRDALWSGSRTGLMGDAYIKPDLVAPGMSITAAAPGGGYQTMTGTSQATPHVTGSVALLKEEHPDWTPDEIKAALTSTADDLPGLGAFREGAGRVDVDRATRQSVRVDAGLLDLGYFAQPYDPAALHPTRTLTYRNDGDSPVTLALTSTLAPKFGDPPPAGTLTVTPQTLTVPAGGSAQAAVALDATLPAAGEYSGRITATGADVEVDTALGFYKQDDTVDVTFRALDRNGQPGTARLRIAPYVHNDGRYYPDNIYLDPAQTEWTLRLPRGQYNVFGLISTMDASSRWVESDSIVGNPQLDVQAPNFTVTLDARKARPVSLETPRKSTPHYVTLDWSRGDPDNPIATYDEWYWDQEDGAPTQLLVAPTKTVSDAQFSVTTSWDAGVPVLEATANGQPLSAVLTGGPYVDGRHSYATAAFPGEVRGKLALVREDPSVSFDDQIQAAAGAGAAVVALYSAQPGVFYPYASQPASVPVIALPQADAARLLSRPNASVTLIGTPRTPYDYDVAFVEKQHVGTDLAYRVKPSDLAEVGVRVHTTGTGEAGWVLNQNTYTGCDCAPPAVGDYVPSTGYVRTQYVTARPDVVDYTAWQFQLGLPADVLVQRSGQTYQPGQSATQDWLKAPFSPGVADSTNGNTQLSSRRIGDSIFYNIVGLTDSAGNWTQQLSGSSAKSALYLGDEQLYSSAFGLRGTASVPADAGQYRLVTDVDHDGSVIGLSTQAHTEWTFPSAASAQGALPLIDVDYSDVADAVTGQSALDLANTARASQAVSLHLTTSHQVGSTAPPVDQVSVQVSYDDGANWQAAAVRASGTGQFQATYRHPAQGQYVSLRVSAADSAGNGEQQTLIRAYRLR